MATPALQFKRGLFANLPGLRAGEPGFTTDRYELYVGIDSTTDNNQLVGSSRFWHVGAGTTGWGVNLLEGTDNGTDYISLRSPAALAGIVTYYFPGTQGFESSVLTNDGNGNLSWTSGNTTNPVFAGIATFTDTTDNTLGDSNTGSVHIDGGLGVDKNVTVGGNLNVQGYSEFVGVATFKGGTINLGDADTDDINVGGEFISGLVPDATKTYDLGELTKQWRDIYAGGSLYGTESIVGTASSTRVDYAVTVASKTADHRYFGSGFGSAYFIDGVESPFITLLPGKTYRFDQSDTSNSGHPLRFYFQSDKTDEWTTNVTTNGTPGSVGAYTEITISDTTPQVLHYQCSSHALMGNAVSAQSNVVDTPHNANIRGNVSIGQTLTVSGDLYVLGTTSEVNTETLKVEDSLVEVGLVNSGGTLVPPVSDLNIDVGVLFHYHTGAAAKKAGLFWDDSVSRVVVGSDLTESSSVMTIATYASFEIGSLWVNDAAGQSEVIRHDGTQRVLENITIDCGTF